MSLSRIQQFSDNGYSLVSIMVCRSMGIRMNERRPPPHVSVPMDTTKSSITPFLKKSTSRNPLKPAIKNLEMVQVVSSLSWKTRRAHKKGTIDSNSTVPKRTKLFRSRNLATPPLHLDDLLKGKIHSQICSFSYETITRIGSKQETPLYWFQSKVYKTLWYSVPGRFQEGTIMDVFPSF